MAFGNPINHPDKHKEVCALHVQEICFMHAPTLVLLVGRRLRKAHNMEGQLLQGGVLADQEVDGPSHGREVAALVRIKVIEIAVPKVLFIADGQGQ